MKPIDKTKDRITIAKTGEPIVVTRVEIMTIVSDK